ncbi:3833_t:CDS:2 [Scutellospora calospora]|uniref:3833_t:CDS:1 n=1 Tax=Scutellospora calospora TaxID=85575 RepID=A0ACA9KDI8_9GLOM|nr:3833_t:CDS:2 [Scutellospora calospora]
MIVKSKNLIGYLPEILNEALKDINIGDIAKVIDKINEDPKFDDLQKEINELKNTRRPAN